MCLSQSASGWFGSFLEHTVNFFSQPSFQAPFMQPVPAYGINYRQISFPDLIHHMPHLESHNLPPGHPAGPLVHGLSVAYFSSLCIKKIWRFACKFLLICNFFLITFATKTSTSDWSLFENCMQCQQEEISGIETSQTGRTMCERSFPLLLALYAAWYNHFFKIFLKKYIKANTRQNRHQCSCHRKTPVNLPFRSEKW